MNFQHTHKYRCFQLISMYTKMVFFFYNARVSYWIDNNPMPLRADAGIDDIVHVIKPHWNPIPWEQITVETWPLVAAHVNCTLNKSPRMGACLQERKKTTHLSFDHIHLRSGFLLYASFFYLKIVFFLTVTIRQVFSSSALWSPPRRCNTEQSRVCDLNGRASEWMCWAV